MTSKPHYRVTLNDRHLTLDVWDTDPTDETQRQLAIVTFAWYPPEASAFVDHYYGFHITLPRDCQRASHVIRAGRMVARIAHAIGMAREYPEPKHDMNGSTQPEQVCKALDKLRARQVVYDARTSDYLLLASVPAEMYHAWRDNWTAYGHHANCAAGALARDAAEARALVLADWARNLAGSIGARANEQRMGAWIAAGRPVLDITTRHGSSFAVPDVQTWQEILAA